MRKAAGKKRSWRTTPDDILCAGQARMWQGNLRWAPEPRAESLCPGLGTLERAVLCDDLRAL